MVRTYKLTNEIVLLAVLALLCYAVGSLVNVFRGDPLGVIYESPAQRLIKKSGGSSPSVSKEMDSDLSIEAQAIHEEIRLVEQSELLEWMNLEKTIIVDVRPSLFFQLGHIQHSVNLQIKEFETDYQKLKDLLEKAKPEQKEIVLYCAGPHCPDASTVAADLKERGYVNLCVYEGGWEEWEKAGLPSGSTL